MNTEPTEEITTAEPSNEQIAVITQTAMANIADVAENKKKLVALIEKHKDAKFTDLEDKEGIKAVQTAYSETRQARLAVDKLGKNFKGVVKQILEHGEKQIGELLEIVSPHEVNFKKEKDRIDGLKEEAKQEELRKAEEKKQVRIASLHSIGFTFNGQAYSLGVDLTISSLQIAQFTDTQFETFLNNAKKVHEQIEQEKAEAEQLRLQEEQKRANEAEALRKQNEAAQVSINAQNAALAEMMAERKENRIKELKSKNFVETSLRRVWEYRDFLVHFDLLEDGNKAEWDAKMVAADTYIEEVHKPKVEEPKPSGLKVGDKTIVGTITKIEKSADELITATHTPFEDEPIHGANPLEPTEEYKAIRVYHTVTIDFSQERPFIDVPVGNSGFMRVYVVEFLDETNAATNAANVKATGTFGDSELLYLLIKN